MQFMALFGTPGVTNALRGLGMPNKAMRWLAFWHANSSAYSTKPCHMPTGTSSPPNPCGSVPIPSTQVRPDQGCLLAVK